MKMKSYNFMRRKIEKVSLSTPDCSKRCDVKKRFIVAFFGFFGMFNVYALRVNLSVALVAMVNSTQESNKTRASVECPMLLKNKSYLEDESLEGEQFNWDPNIQGHILGSFFYGYIITQLPGGIMAERYGAKWVFSGGILITSILTLFSPLAAHLGVGVFIALRVMEGLASGVTFPSVTAVISHWAPKLERSRISTAIFTGAQTGNVVTMPISGLLCSSVLGWPSTFYIFGTLGCIWFIFWASFIYETPDVHMTISPAELEYIRKHQDHIPKKVKTIPWKSIFTSLPMWAVIMAHIGHNFGFLILFTEMPTYLGEILHFDIKANGFLSALPYVVQTITAWVTSYFADRLRESKTLTTTNIRKIFNSIGLFGPATCLLGVTLAGCRPILTVFLFCLALGFNAFIYSGFNITHVDMSPDFAGTLFGITNAISNISGIVGPYVVGKITSRGVTLANWCLVFYITVTIYVVCALFYAIFASAQVQPWGIAKMEPKDEASLNNTTQSAEDKSQ